MKNLTLTLAFFLVALNIYSQEIECVRYANPDYAQSSNTDLNRGTVAVAPSNDSYVFNVKIHYIKNTNGTGVNFGKEQAQNAMMILNGTYNKMKIYFKLAGFDYIYNSDYKKIRSTNKKTNMNHPLISQLVTYSKTGMEKPVFDENALNIYVVENINENPQTFSGNTNGIGYLPGTVSFFTYNSFLTTTLLHEIGHNFNLEHTYNLSGTANCELVTGVNAETAGDFVADTPATPLILPSSDYSSSCSYVNTLKLKDCQGNEFKDVILTNIMGHDNPCRDLDENLQANEVHFTKGQENRMRLHIQKFIDNEQNMYGYNKARTTIDKLYEPLEQVAQASDNGLEVTDHEFDLGMANVCKKADEIVYEFQKGFNYALASDEDGSKKIFSATETPRVTVRNPFSVTLLDINKTKKVTITPVLSDEFTCEKQKYVAINVATTTNFGNGSIHYKEFSEEEINSLNIFDTLPKNTYNIVTKQTESGIKISKKIYKY